MDATERKHELLIDWDASHLAFRIGFAVRRSLMQKAIEHARARNAATVTVDDVQAVATGIDMVAARRAAEVASDGEGQIRATHGTSDAA
jgi:hypothetical protein